MDANTSLLQGLAGRLDPGELAALAQLIGPSDADRRLCADRIGQAAAAALHRGRGEGRAQMLAEVRAADKGLIRDMRVEAARWHVPCPACRQASLAPDRKTRSTACPPNPHGLCGCPACGHGTRATFGQPLAGDFPGRGQAALAS